MVLKSVVPGAADRLIMYKITEDTTHCYCGAYGLERVQYLRQGRPKNSQVTVSHGFAGRSQALHQAGGRLSRKEGGEWIP